MTDPHGRREEWPDAIRGVAIAMVIGMHTLPYTQVMETGWGPLIDFLVSTIAVPVFFFVDGYLLGSGRSREAPYPRYLARSAYRLLWPWIAFSLLYLLVRWAGERAGIVGESLVSNAGPSQLLLVLYTSQVSAQLYFLPALFAIRVVAPALRPLRRAPEWIPALVFLAYALAYRLWLRDTYLSTVQLPGLDPLQHALWGLQYHLLGVFAGRVAPRMARLAPFVLAGSLALLIAGRVVYLVPYAFVPYAYLAAAVAILLLAEQRASVLAALGRRTMGIYLLHAPIIVHAAARGLQVLAVSEPTRFLLVASTTLGASLLATRALERSRLGRLLLAERRAAPPTQGSV